MTLKRTCLSVAAALMLLTGLRADAAAADFTYDAPAIIRVGYNVIVVYRGTDNRLYWRTTEGNGELSWSPTAAINGSVDATVSAPTIAAFNNFVYVFYRGTDDRVYQTRIYIDDVLTWNNNWTSSVPIGNSYTLSAPAAITMFENNRMHVFYRGTDDGIYQVLTSDGTNWTSPVAVHPGGTATTSAPAVGAATYNQYDHDPTLYLFHRGSDNNIYYCKAVDVYSFTGWTPILPGSVQSSDAPSVSFHKADVYNRYQLLVTYRGFDGLIYSALDDFSYETPPDEWTGPSLVAGGIPTGSAPGSMKTGTWLIYRTDDNRIMYRTRDPEAGTWSSPSYMNPQ
jgi:hypothetical protein